MKTKTTLTTVGLALLLGLAAALTSAQDAPDPGRPPHPGPGGPGGPGFEGRRPIPPLMAALDANHDGVIDEAEIANAPAALRTLDKNGDGKLTMDELRPARPDGAGPGGPGGPRGPRGPRPEPPQDK